MNKKLLSGLAVGLLLFGTAQIAGAISITNGSFETGDLSGWTKMTSGGGSVSVVTSESGYAATDGRYFADLTATSLVSQCVTWNTGDTLTFNWNFIDKDVFPDFSIFQIKNGNSILFDLTLAAAGFRDDTTTGWQTYTYTFASTGTGSFAFGVYNAWDNLFDSKLLVDNVKGSSAPVPEPATMLLLGTGIAGLAATRLRKKSQ